MKPVTMRVSSTGSLFPLNVSDLTIGNNRSDRFHLFSRKSKSENNRSLLLLQVEILFHEETSVLQSPGSGTVLGCLSPVPRSALSGSLRRPAVRSCSRSSFLIVLESSGPRYGLHLGKTFLMHLPMAEGRRRTGD